MSLSADDLAHFSDESFDVKAWINRACAQHPDRANADRYGCRSSTLASCC